MKKRFLVKWEIDEFAENPLEAIKKAILALPHAGNENTLATVFDVEEIDENGKTIMKFQIDVLDVNPFEENEERDFDEHDSSMLYGIDNN